MVVWLGLAASVPTWAVDGAAMRHSAGISYGSYQYQDVVWVMTRPGEVSERIVTWPGTTEIAIVAAAYTTTGIAPRMRLSLDDREVRDWQLAAGQGTWLQQVYSARVRTRFGRPTLRLEFADLLDRRDVRQVQHAYVGRIRFTRVADGAAAGGAIIESDARVPQ
jgi:hypothetical protein